MKIKQLFFFTGIALIMASCGNSQKESSAEESVPETTVEVDSNSNKNESYSVQKTEDNQPKSFTIGYKEITVVNGVTTKDEIKKILGTENLNMDYGDMMTYYWDSEDGTEHSVAFRFDDNGVLTSAEERAVK